MLGRTKNSRRTVALVLVAAGLFCLAPTFAQAQPGPQEKERQRLLNQLGLEKKKAPPGPSPSLPPGEAALNDAATAPVADQPEAEGEGDKEASGKGQESSARRVVPFTGTVHRLLIGSCKACHTTGGSAGASGYVLTNSVAEDHAASRRFITRGNPRDSALVTRSIGVTHGGGAVFSTDSSSYRLLLRWIAGGAVLGAAPPTAQPLAPVAGDATRSAPRSRVAKPATGTGPSVRPPDRSQPSAAATFDRGTDLVEVLPSQSQDGEAGGGEAGWRQAFAQVHLTVLQGCAPCHNAVGSAAGTRLLLSGDGATDHAALLPFTNRDAPDSSLLVTKTAGREHGGGAVYPEGSDLFNSLVLWIHDGAPGPAVEVSAPDHRDTPSTPTTEATTPAPTTGLPLVRYPSVTGGHASGGISGLPHGLTLNGRFDLNYERRAFSANPFSGGGHSALENYHRFVFLGRESTHDPFGFTAEVLNLSLWEAHYRIAPAGAPFRMWVKAGKLLVPFGADPLFHQSYGGLAGFDQRVLPIIWSREGVGAHLLYRQQDLTFTADVYAVRGHRLRKADDFLNLQNDTSTADDTRFAVGQRLGVSWGPLSAWYSGYWNSLGFGRHLYLQALDISVWGLTGIPVLANLSASIGFLRADVSGGGPGHDHYHFASYYRLRYNLHRAVYLQYRQGLRTFGNRRGVIGDDTRFTVDDGSTHNLGLVARYRGVSAGLYYYLLFEKADETDNDFLRAVVTYEF